MRFVIWSCEQWQQCPKPGEMHGNCITNCGIAGGPHQRSHFPRTISLAVTTVPISRRPSAVPSATVDHTNIHQFRWRSVQVPYQSTKSPSLTKAVEGLDGL